MNKTNAARSVEERAASIETTQNHFHYTLPLTENLPIELRELSQWVMWRAEYREGQEKPTKPLYMAGTKRHAKANDPATWTTFSDAEAALATGNFSGIGFVFTDSDPYVGIDLDHCVTDGMITPEAQAIVERFASYSEFSPSRTGIHIIIKGSLPTGGNRKDDIELYQTSRYFTMTGDLVPNTPTEIVECNETLAQFHAELFPPKTGAKQSKKLGSEMTDEEVLAKARKFGGKAFADAFDHGDISGYDNDDSKADYQVQRQIQFLTDDGARTERIFQQSILAQREKYREREDYRGITLQKVVASVTQTYNPYGVAQTQSERHLHKSEGQPTDNADNAKLASFPETDLGNAERFVVRFGESLRYCAEWGQWLYWDGRRWQADKMQRVMRWAQSTVRRIYWEAAAIAEDDEKRADSLSKWAKKSEARDRLKALIELAQSHYPMAVSSDEFDSDQWLFNVTNGTIDLRTGKLKTHDPKDLITKLACVRHDPKAAAPVFMRFLERVLPDLAVRQYLQSVSGYSLTGDVREQALFFLYGSGANGKTTFLNALLDTIGNYGIQAAPDLLVAKQGTHPTEIADLCGARCVVTVEVEDGKRMAEGLVKQMTGGDRMKARKMRQDFFEFVPTHKTFFSANHRPIVRGTDYAIWRRIKMIPFEVTITDAEKDKDLPNKLRTEVSGILNWMLAGCERWQKDGLPEPDAVKAATAEYRADMDVIGQFIESECILEENERCGAKELFERFKQYCEASGEHYGTQKVFGTKLTEKGFVKGRGSKGQTIYLGISLKDRDDGSTLFGDSEPPETPPSEPSESTDERGAEPSQGLGVLPQEESLTKSVIPENGSDGSDGSVLLRVTATQKEIADNLARQRKAGHDHCRKMSEDAGSHDANLSRDYFGLLGELVVRQALEAIGCDIPAVPLVSGKAESRPDLELFGVRVDIKASRPNYGSLAINIRQHQEKEVKPDYYLPLLFEDTETVRVMAPILYEEISGWKRVENVPRPFFAIEREQLKDLPSLMDLIAFCKTEQEWK